MDKDQAKKQICNALQPMLPMGDILLAMLMGDAEKLDGYRKEVQLLRGRCAAYHDELDKCASAEEMEAVLGKVTRE